VCVWGGVVVEKALGMLHLGRVGDFFLVGLGFELGVSCLQSRNFNI
jgi:hypothetical protein